MRGDMKQESFVEEMRKVFVTMEVFNLRFSPVEKIVYGFTGMVLVAFASALVVLVIKKG